MPRDALQLGKLRTWYLTEWPRSNQPGRLGGERRGYDRSSMTRKLRSLAIGAAVAAGGGLLLLGSETGWLVYGFERIRGGQTARIAGVCYQIPPQWTLVTNTQDEVDIRRHFTGTASGQFATIQSDTRWSAIARRVKEDRQLDNGFVLFTLEVDLPSNPVRYVAVNRETAVLVVGAERAAIADLARRLARCS